MEANLNSQELIAARKKMTFPLSSTCTQNSIAQASTMLTIPKTNSYSEYNSQYQITSKQTKPSQLNKIEENEEGLQPKLLENQQSNFKNQQQKVNSKQYDSLKIKSIQISLKQSENKQPQSQSCIQSNQQETFLRQRAGPRKVLGLLEEKHSCYQTGVETVTTQFKEKDYQINENPNNYIHRVIETETIDKQSEYFLYPLLIKQEVSQPQTPRTQSNSYRQFQKFCSNMKKFQNNESCFTDRQQQPIKKQYNSNSYMVISDRQSQNISHNNSMYFTANNLSTQQTPTQTKIQSCAVNMPFNNKSVIKIS